MLSRRASGQVCEVVHAQAGWYLGLKLMAIDLSPLGDSTISMAAGFKSGMGSHRKSAAAAGEDRCKFFQPKLDP